MAAIQSPTIPCVLDVTLRDGGYVNDHSWAPEVARRIVAAVAVSKVPVAEIGYYRPRRHGVDGTTRPAASCPVEYIDQLAAVADGMALAVMAHQTDVRLDDYRMLAEHGIAVVRLPTRTSATERVHDHVAAIHAHGMTAMVNLLRISEPERHEIATAAAAAHKAEADVVYLADSNGSLFPEEVAELVGVVREQTDRAVGFHAHDGLSLAFSNSLAAVQAGCTYVDASLGGLGKGGGNLAMELICGYLRCRGRSMISFSPLAAAADEVLSAWGADAAAARSESIASGLVNLNIDDIARLRAERGELVSVVDRHAEEMLHGAGLARPVIAD